MKRFLLAALTVVSAFTSAQAQQAVPQGGFETWAARPPAALAPTGWLTTDDLLAALTGSPLPISTNTVRRTSTSHGGTYAAELVNATVPGLGVAPGYLFLGTTLNASGYDIGGAPYTSRPTSLEFYYKLTGANAANDSASVFVELVRTVGGNVETIADGFDYVLTPSTTFTRFTLPLTYQSGSIPDSLYIVFSSSDADNLTAGTTLTIDDVAFTGTVANTRDLVADAALSVYPTASADGQFTLSTGNEPALLRGALRVTDATGREVLRQPAPAAPVPSRAIDLRGQVPGIYVLRLETASGPLTRKLVVL